MQIDFINLRYIDRITILDAKGQPEYLAVGLLFNFYC